MIPASDPVLLIERMAWFDTAFRGVCKPATERLQIELESHYDHVFQQSRDAGGSELEAHRAGMAALGNAEAERKRFRAKYLTERQYRTLAQDGAFLSPPYSRSMNHLLGCLIFTPLQLAGLALASHNPNLIGGYTFAAFLAIVFAVIAILLRGRAPRGQYAWTSSLLGALLGTAAFVALLPWILERWSSGTPFHGPDALLHRLLWLLLLLMATLPIALWWHLRLLEKARNTGLIGPKRNESVQRD